jgi:hypothetical protein
MKIKPLVDNKVALAKSKFTYATGFKAIKIFFNVILEPIVLQTSEPIVWQY